MLFKSPTLASERMDTTLFQLALKESMFLWSATPTNITQSLLCTCSHQTISNTYEEGYKNVIGGIHSYTEMANGGMRRCTCGQEIDACKKMVCTIKL